MKNWYKFFALVLLALCSCGKEPAGTDGSDSDVVKNPNVFGKVCDAEGNAIAGVVVSDGFSSVKTDAAGEYKLEADLDKAKFIFVSQPAGYRAEVKDGLSKFYKVLGSGDVKPDGGRYTVDFTLERIADPERYTVVISADPQPRERNVSTNLDKIAYHSLDCVDDLFRDIKENPDVMSGTNVCGIVLGDIVHENMNLYANYKNNLKDLPFPTYAVIGNHDNNTKYADDDKAAGDFESHFGPRNYSFNLGKIHVVVLDNLIMGKDGDPKAYTQGLTDDIWKWLKSDLKHVDRSSTVMVCAHSPMFRLEDGSERYASGNTRHGWDYANLFNEFKKVYAWAGHTHTMFNYIPAESSKTCNVETHTLSRSTGALWTNEWVCNDGTPRGYVVLKIDGENVSWKFKPTKYQSDPSSTRLMEYKRRSVSSNVISVGEKELDASYQMIAYPRGSYKAKSGEIDEKGVYVNVFMWDENWEKPKFKGADGRTSTMTRVEASSSYDRYDLEAFDISAFYSKKYSEIDYDAEVYHLFRFASSKSSDSGTISVTDRFGNTYTTTVSW